MAGAESNVSSGRKKIGNSLTKQARRAKQLSKLKQGKSAIQVVQQTNSTIRNPLDLVIEATQKKRQQLLLSDKAHGQTELTKVKWTQGIRPAKVLYFVWWCCLLLLQPLSTVIRYCYSTIYYYSSTTPYYSTTTPYYSTNTLYYFTTTLLPLYTTQSYY